MLKEVLAFLKHPVYLEDENRDFDYRMSKFWKLLIFALALSLLLGSLNGGLELLFDLDFGKHAIDGFMDQYSPWFLLLAAVVLAPVLEELFFRGPLVFFKKSSFFKYIFYLFTLVFGFYHITNFQLSTTTLLLSPLLVAPQLGVGVFLGFVRVRFGLVWAIALHALYNLVLIGPFVVLQLFDVSLD